MNTVPNGVSNTPSAVIEQAHVDLTKKVYGLVKEFSKTNGLSTFAISQIGEVSDCDIPYSYRHETHFRVSCMRGYGLEIYVPGRRGGNLKILNYDGDRFWCGYDFGRYAFGNPDYFFLFGGDRPNTLHEGREELYVDFIEELQSFSEVFEKVSASNIAPDVKEDLMNALS